MMETLGCQGTSAVANNASVEDLNRLEYGINPNEKSIVSALCSQNETWCRGATSNTTIGRYGAFSVCNSTERISWTLNQLYSKNNDAGACISAGGVIKSPLTTQSKLCHLMLRQAGQDGSGAVLQTQIPEETQRSGPGKGTVSTSAKVGIAIAILFSVFLAITLIILRHRRKRKREIEKLESSSKAELPASSEPVSTEGLFEVDGNGQVEIEDTQVLEADHTCIAEMPTIHNDPVELDAAERNLDSK
jgi:hypothetical protein